MFTPTVTIDRPWPGKPAARRAQPLAGLAARVARWYRIRRATRQVMALDDHLLRDIGIGRGEIERAVATGRERI